MRQMGRLIVAINWAADGTKGVTPGYGSVSNIALAAITLLIIILIYRFLPGFLLPFRPSCSGS